ncbi:hypothetical protein D5E87_19765 [Vibrio parahaemolyticus]|uniref:hypothetical protein n=1 Tax=Vibrio harveyi group TaxID=717610 RepID=UPI00047051DE|nr:MULTISPECIES: hypothetical protein [Vibrio harveyi group]ATA65935.1 hypothetical protein MAVP-R_00019 [Vibrio parahaemolyticus]AWA90540.1 hypothetical protein BSG32_16515 [Vibrio parahaemolyticus]EGQ7815451.1 hypothetical protein [Vibrio parahaemolyticus]EHR5465857.1 hypothetical protein [Vibrio parahaemolyticus]KAB0317961.1 hypothetical protein F6W79_23965 [Vibrio diabolicus]
MILGIRCSTNDFSFAVLSGKIETPQLLEVQSISFPAKYSQPEKLKWFLDELQELNRKHAISSWAIKGAEPMAAKGKSYADRVELEAMISLSAAILGSSSVVRKVKPTIAKDLGLKGRAKSLVEDLDFTQIAGLDQKNDKEFEAIVVAWSCL